MDAREQGLVLIEANISPGGCVDAATVHRGASDLLDLAALVAAAQWRYTPVELNGRPVPAQMTLTVSFRLE